MNNGAINQVEEDLRENGWLSPEDQKLYKIFDKAEWDKLIQSFHHSMNWHQNYQKENIWDKGYHEGSEKAFAEVIRMLESEVPF
jgi:hypothetical protein